MKPMFSTVLVIVFLGLQSTDAQEPTSEAVPPAFTVRVAQTFQPAIGADKNVCATSCCKISLLSFSRTRDFKKKGG